MPITDYPPSPGWPAYSGYTCGCGAWVPNGASHICPTWWTAPPAAAPMGYTCPACGWVAFGHVCPKVYSPSFTVGISPCPDCKQLVIPGIEHDCPARKPLPPVADAVARVRGWLAQAQEWLERNRI